MTDARTMLTEFCGFLTGQSPAKLIGASEVVDADWFITRVDEFLATTPDAATTMQIDHNWTLDDPLTGLKFKIVPGVTMDRLQIRGVGKEGLVRDIFFNRDGSCDGTGACFEDADGQALSWTETREDEVGEPVVA